MRILKPNNSQSPVGNGRFLRSVLNRFYSDFMLQDRTSELRLLLERALSLGYEVHSIASFWEQIKAGGPRPGLHLVLRLDIDTDLRTTRALWQLLRDLGVRGTFYFRLSTLDVRLMQAIHEAGSEASYHYEELAAYAKRYRLRSRAEVEAHMPAIRALFADNYRRVKAQTGLPLHTVASHGDWLNRKLGVINLELLQDPALREVLGIELEAYDAALQQHYTQRYSDGPYPTFWLDGNPLAALESRQPVIEVLLHPRHWRANIPVNATDNLRRVWEALDYRLTLPG
ncbi:hypothetical protein [Meiothermus hypogaeus]|uniref:NodB homology domain-containing protein n=2 Tax=Meiothermus hypogaeus TaxID=884155 RepID=A0A511QZN2_9DEIN|nr:hypothetical protein [Meiothermus hypogaeus]RIH76894.1 hypothetical protein Mhypo_02227 [Meiothermus hypogaeus]GEM82829.1 hypothetical protein MHY01S_09950 [Meiothermus hypogaeus NBRC 106114]